MTTGLCSGWSAAAFPHPWVGSGAGNPSDWSTDWHEIRFQKWKNCDYAETISHKRFGDNLSTFAGGNGPRIESSAEISHIYAELTAQFCCGCCNQAIGKCTPPNQISAALYGTTRENLKFSIFGRIFRENFVRRKNQKCFRSKNNYIFSELRNFLGYSFDVKNYVLSIYEVFRTVRYPQMRFLAL